jgi:hypothetical protein
MPINESFAGQVVQVHARFINKIVDSCRNPAAAGDIEPLLAEAEQVGWTRLVAAVRRILDGRRDRGLLEGLDEEDRIIAQAILSGIADPSTLPDPEAQPDAVHAAPGLAHMIHLARRGDAQALQMVAAMGEQMVRAGGDMARLGGTFRALIDGERDAGKLARGMGPSGRGLLFSLVEELGRLDQH